MAILQAKVDRVAYPSPSPADTEKGQIWYIIITDKGCCKGKVGWRPEPGERLKFEGQWEVYQGRKEFGFKGATQDIPVSARDQLMYVCERSPGVGTAMEMQIWEIWGESWMAEVESGVVSRLSGKTYEDFRGSIDTFVLEKEKAEAISWLMGKGATLGLATAAWDSWDKQTITVVNVDCYRLAELPNYGFTNVDTSMRFKFDIGDQDPRRIKAAVVYCMKQLTERGSTVVTWTELHFRCTEVLKGMYSQLICDCVMEQFKAGTLRAFSDTESLSLGRDYENESDIWKYATRQELSERMSPDELSDDYLESDALVPVEQALLEG